MKTSIPDYAAAGDVVAGFLQAALRLVPGDNLYRDQTWSANPDRVVCLYENGGAWDVDRNVWVGVLQLTVRAARLVEAHALMRGAIGAALNGLDTCPVANRNGLFEVTLGQAPRVLQRDDKNRVYIDAALTIQLSADYGR